MCNKGCPEQEKTKLSRGRRSRIKAGIFSRRTKTPRKSSSVSKNLELTSLDGESRGVCRFPVRQSPAGNLSITDRGGNERVHRSGRRSGAVS